MKRKPKATTNSIPSDFELLTLLQQEQKASDAELWQEQMANEKQYKVMQLEIEECKLKVEDQKNGYAKTRTANKDRKAKGRS